MRPLKIRLLLGTEFSCLVDLFIGGSRRVTFTQKCRGGLGAGVTLSLYECRLNDREIQWWCRLSNTTLLPHAHLCPSCPLAPYEIFTTFNFLSCANNDSNPFCRDHVNHIYDATSKQVKVGAEVEEEKGYV